MDLLNGSSSSTTSYQQEVELLEECWFFENLLTCSKPKMSRCNSDPCPSTNFDALTTNQEQFLISNAIDSSKTSTMNGNSKIVAPKLVRAPSLPSNVMAPSLPSNIMAAKTVEVIQQNGKHDLGEIMQDKPQAVVPPRNTLHRAPSLPPPCKAEEEDEEDEDQESEFRLGRLIRQASLKSSDTFLPPRQTAKSASIARRSRKKIVLMDGNKEMGNQYQMNQTKKGKLPSDIQKKEVERIKALSSQFEKQCLENEIPKSKLSSLQDKSWSDQLEDKKFRRPYTISDAPARPLMRSSTSIPKWATAAAENDKRSSQDMKAQIKFWARAVASNARAPGVL